MAIKLLIRSENDALNIKLETTKTMLKLIALFSLIIATHVLPLPIFAAIGPFKSVYSYSSPTKKSKQVAVAWGTTKSGKHFVYNKINRKNNNGFISNGGIGKISLWLLGLTFILVFWGSFIFPISPLIILLSLICSLLLALIGSMMGGQNREKAELTLIVFAILAIIAVIGLGIAWLILRQRGE